VGRTDHLSPWRKPRYCHCYSDRYDIQYRDTHKHWCPHCNPNGYTDWHSTGYSYSHGDRYSYRYAYRRSSCYINTNTYLYTNRSCSQRLSKLKIQFQI